MIFKTLEFLRSNLNQFIQAQNPDENGVPSTDQFVTLGEVSLLDGPDQSKIEDTIVMSLVFTEEEAALKNSSPYVVRDSKVEVKNPPVFLNLGVIFCANFTDNYAESLIRIPKVFPNPFAAEK